MTQEALKELLEAVEAAIHAGDWKVDGACDPDLVIRRAKEALAQPEQEPVAWRFKPMIGSPWSLSDDGYYISCKRDQRYIVEPLYTAPQPKQPEPVQEPVAWVSKKSVIVDGLWETEETISLYDDGGQPLYTAPPPQCQWVGLTDEEIKALPQWFPSHETAAVLPLIRAIEVKLREKNT